MCDLEDSIVLYTMHSPIHRCPKTAERYTRRWRLTSREPFLIPDLTFEFGFSSSSISSSSGMNQSAKWTLMPNFVSFIDQWEIFLDWLGPITLAQIGRAIYNPPTPLGLTITAVLLAYQAPVIYQRWIGWRLSRRVVQFDWPEPKVCTATVSVVKLMMGVGSRSELDWTSDSLA